MFSVGIFRKECLKERLNMAVCIRKNIICRHLRENRIIKPNQIICNQLRKAGAAGEGFVDKFRHKKAVDDLKIFTVSIAVIATVVDNKIVAFVDLYGCIAEGLHCRAVEHIYELIKMVAVQLDGRLNQGMNIDFMTIESLIA